MTTTRHNDHAALILRLSLGAMFIAHGLLKILVFTLPDTAVLRVGGVRRVARLSVTFAEISGGALLIAGIATRWAAIALLPVWLGALLVHWNNGWLFTNSKGGWEYPAFLAVASIAQAFLASGAMAVKWPRRTELASATSG